MSPGEGSAEYMMVLKTKAEDWPVGLRRT